MQNKGKIISSKKNKNKKISNKAKKRIEKIIVETKQPTKNILNLTKEYRSKYKEALLHPEHVFGAKVPRQYGTLTVPLHRHTSVQISANTLGNMAIIFDPYYLHDNSTNKTTLLINTDATYNGTNCSSTVTTAIAVPQLLPAGNIQGYRLVSSSIHILPQSSVTNAAGRIYGALVPYAQIAPQTVGAALTQSGIDIVNVNTQPIQSEACISQLEASRICWLPFDIDSFEILNVNEAFSTDGSTHPGYVFIAIVIGAAAAAPFTLEIFQNFECTTTANSVLCGMESGSKSNEDPITVLSSMNRKGNDVCGTFRSHSDFTIDQKTGKPGFRGKGPSNWWISTQEKDYMEKLIARIGLTKEYHMPGYNYMGPGTNVLNRLERLDNPINIIDEIAKQHDIDFLMTSGEYTGGLLSNIKAIYKTYIDPLSIDGFIMRAGLSLENLIRTITFGKIIFNTNLPNLSNEETKVIGNYLNDKYGS